MCVDLPVWNPEPLAWGFALEREGFAASSWRLVEIDVADIDTLPF